MFFFVLLLDRDLSFFAFVNLFSEISVARNRDFISEVRLGRIWIEFIYVG